MDNLTHSLFGLTVARTPLGRAGRGTTVALLLASNAPDIDIVTTMGGAASYLHWHRGPTHGPLGIIGLALVCALVARAIAGWRRKPDDAPPGRLVSLWLVAMVGVLGHVLMDLPTSYGTRPFSPFSYTWFAEDWMPIVDVYLLAILGGGLLLTRRAARGGVDLRARNAAIAIGLMLANYGLRAVSHHLALASAPAIFAGLPARCASAVPEGSWIDWWPRATAEAAREVGSARCLIEIAAMPDFVSPFRWQLIAHLSNAYERRAVDLLDASSRSGNNVQRLSVRYPNQWTPAVANAAHTRVGQIFLGFSRFPAARSSLDAQGVTTVRWSDMRFAMNRIGTDERRSGIFLATVRVSADGLILDQHLGP